MSVKNRRMRKIIKTDISKVFSERELMEIYNNIVKKDSNYFKKNNPLPNCPIISWNFNWSGHDLPRNFAILDFREWIKKHNISNGQELGITGKDDPELNFLNYNNKNLLSYPPYDLHKYYSIFNNKFDFFIFNQTIEHLYNPFLALENIYKYIKSGGYIYTSVPTINIPHLTPIHYNGYNPMGLALLFISVGFEVLETGQWGNYEYINKLFKDHKWPDANKVSHINEEKNVAQCWILAKKP